MIEIGKAVRIKGWDIVGTVVSHHDKYNTVQYQTQVFGEPNKVRLNQYGCTDEELEILDER